MDHVAAEIDSFCPSKQSPKIPYSLQNALYAAAAIKRVSPKVVRTKEQTVTVKSPTTKIVDTVILPTITREKEVFKPISGRPISSDGIKTRYGFKRYQV